MGDNKTYGNQSNERVCGRCGGSGVVTESKTDAKGNTVTTTSDCPTCGGSGKG